MSSHRNGPRYHDRGLINEQANQHTHTHTPARYTPTVVSEMVAGHSLLPPPRLCSRSGRGRHNTATNPRLSETTNLSLGQCEFPSDSTFLPALAHQKCRRIACRSLTATSGDGFVPEAAGPQQPHHLAQPQSSLRRSYSRGTCTSTTLLFSRHGNGFSAVTVHGTGLGVCMCNNRSSFPHQIGRRRHNLPTEGPRQAW